MHLLIAIGEFIVHFSSLPFRLLVNRLRKSYCDRKCIWHMGHISSYTICIYLATWSVKERVIQLNRVLGSVALSNNRVFHNIDGYHLDTYLLSNISYGSWTNKNILLNQFFRRKYHFVSLDSLDMCNGLGVCGDNKK